MVTGAPVDVVMIGGGVIGLTAAWAAASAGMTVTVVDRDPGHGASWAAAGMLAPVGEAQFGEEQLTALNVQAARAWPIFAHELEADTGQSVGYRTDGTLLVAVDGSDRAATDDVLSFQHELGLPASRLSSRECRASEPLLAPGIRGGVELADDHQVDNRRLVDALMAACTAQGVHFSADEVSEVSLERERVAGVVLRLGDRITAGSVVLAAGSRSGQVGGLLEAQRPPVRPVKGLTMRLRATDGAPALRRTVRGLVHGRSCYLVPRQDRTLVIGATVEEKGFDTSIQIGPVSDLLNDARTLVPSIEEYELIDTTVGLRPGSPDNAPIVGSTEVGGLIVATGHFRHGILLAPITALEVVRLLQGGAGDTGLFGPFGPGRFRPGRVPAGPAPVAIQRTAVR